MDSEKARHLTPCEVREAKQLFKHSMSPEILFCQAVGAAKEMPESLRV